MNILCAGSTSEKGEEVPLISIHFIVSNKKGGNAPPSNRSPFMGAVIPVLDDFVCFFSLVRRMVLVLKVCLRDFFFCLSSRTSSCCNPCSVGHEQ